MFSITNTKVAGFEPQWAAFRGYSVLFDNPGDSLTRFADRLDLTSDVEGNAFYKTLRQSLASLNLNLLTNTYLFCPLPPASYHVTVWDGGNESNAAKMLPPHQQTLRDLLTGLPDALMSPCEITNVVIASPLVTKRDYNIRLRFDSVQKWSNIVLAARLTPADQASSDALEALAQERKRLNARYQQAYGISASDNYTPHVSLGYFANRESAQLATPCVAEWSRQFAETMQGLTLEFSQASLYGFTDMATFFKRAS